MDRLVSKPHNNNALIIPSKLYALGSNFLRLCVENKFNSNDVPYSCCAVAHPWNPSCTQTSLYLFNGCMKESFKIYGFLYLASCHQVLHPYHPSCSTASLLACYWAFKEGTKIYSMLYAVTAILRRKQLKYYIQKLPKEILQSSIFLSANCGLFMVFFCIARRIFGRISYGGTLLMSLPACFLAIIIERKQRRGLLALYLTNLATETAFNMMLCRGWISSIYNGEVLIFSLVSAVYVYLYQNNLLDGGFLNILKKFLGEDEILKDVNNERKSRIVKYYGFVTDIMSNFLNIASPRGKHNKFFHAMKSMQHKIDEFLTKLSKAERHKHVLCTHRYSCLIYSISGFLQRFLIGFILQAGIKLVGSIGAIIRKPKVLKKILSNDLNFKLGLFFGSYQLIYRFVSCLLRWFTNKNKSFHSLISGFFAGWSMLFYKSSSITLYLIFKLFEILWMLGVKKGKLPFYENFDALLYTISTAFILWVGIYEPHNIRPQYWKFLVRISSHRFAEINRRILDVFNTDASRITRMVS